MAVAPSRHVTPDLPAAPADSAGAVIPPADIASLQSRAVRGSMWTMIHVIVSVPIAFIANAIVARALGAEDYGRLAFLTLMLSIVMGATSLGVSDGVIQWGAAAHARGDHEQVDSLLRRSLGFNTMIQLPILLLTVFVLAHDDGLGVMAALAISVIMQALVGSVALAITIENRSAASAKLAMGVNLLTQVVVSGAAVITPRPAAVWAARSLTTSAVLPLNFLLVSKRRRRPLVQVRFPSGMPQGFWRFGLFTAAGGLVGLLVFSRSELLLLQKLGTAEAVGLFALAFGLAQQVTAPVDALLNPLLPAVAGIVESHPERVRETLLRATRISSLLCAALCVGVFPILYVLIPFIYGPDFSGAATAFLVLGVTSCLQSAVNPLLTFARARRQAGSLLAINSAALAVDVAVAIVAIPAFGLWGAIVANGAGQITALLLLVRLECKAWGVSWTAYAQAIMTFLSAAAGTLTIVLLDGLGIFGLLQVVTSIGISILAVIGITTVTMSRIPRKDVQPGLNVLPARLRPLVALILRPVMTAESSRP